MTTVTLAGIGLTATFTLLLLAAERRGSMLGRAATKPVASLGFLVAAYGHGALETPHGRWIFGGLVLSALGDVLLISAKESAFLAGLGSFLFGHVAFAVAFAVRGVSVTAAAGALVVTLALGGVVWRWLSPHVGAGMRGPVIAYVGVISVMAALAAGTFVTEASATLLSGALLFAVSDVSVARDRFVAEGYANKLWGLPLYFGAQLLIASASR